MLSVPLMSLVMSPVKAAVLLLPLYVISDLAGIWLYRRDFSAWPTCAILDSWRA
jgi:hypothetical protein